MDEPYIEQLEKERAHQKMMEAQATCAQPQYATGLVGGSSYPPSLRDRLKRKIEAATQEQARARKNSELFDLLEKNPEVARILELLETLQV